MLDFKGAIFDLDGTIIDSLSVWEDIDRKFFEKRNIIITAWEYTNIIICKTKCIYRVNLQTHDETVLFIGEYIYSAFIGISN